MAAQTIPTDACPHRGGPQVTQTEKQQCERCDVREHLRLCTTCGQTFCCESDRAHNREHYLETKHPIIVSTPTTLPYRFTWCWECQAYLKDG